MDFLNGWMDGCTKTIQPARVEEERGVFWAAAWERQKLYRIRFRMRVYRLGKFLGPPYTRPTA